MKTIFARFAQQVILFLIAVVGIAGDPQGTPDSASEVAKLVGDWVCVSAETDGKPMSQANVALQSRSIVDGAQNPKLWDGIDGFSTLRFSDEQVTKTRFKIDLTKSPKQIDMTVVESVLYHPGDTLFGIYEIRDDTIRFCIAQLGKDRPTEFKTENTGWQLTVWKKKQPDHPPTSK